MIRPVPDRDSAEWWGLVQRGELNIQACDQCGTLRFPARAICHLCHSKQWRWRVVSGDGRIESWIVNHQAFLREVATPYIVVMVRLAEAADCVLFGNWHGDREPKAGELVAASYTRVDADVTLVNWRPKE